MRQFLESEIEPLAIGAWVLGTGGGGSPYHGFLNLKKLYREGRTVQLISPEELADDANVAVVSSMGAPMVGLERLTDPQILVEAVQMMEEYRGVKFDAIMSVEIGGGNAIQPFLAAALMGLPVVDADAMGRAFPEAQMTSFAIADLPMFPLTLADVRDNAVVVARAASWKWMERISRKVCVEVGSVASTCKAPRTGREVKDFGIHGTVTQAVEIGNAVQRAQREHRDPVQAILEQEDGKLVFVGRVWDVERRTTEGFLRGKTLIDGLGDYRGQQILINFQNEYTLISRNGEPLVTTPDLICVLDTVSGEAIGTETLRYGQRVTVIAMRAAPILTTPKGLEHVGPRAFGHDVNFKSVFQS